MEKEWYASICGKAFLEALASHRHRALVWLGFLGNTHDLSVVPCAFFHRLCTASHLSSTSRSVRGQL